MRTEQLQYLIEISKHKSMNIASQKLHISPQALSTAMKGLEKELNMQLLERTTMGVSLTPNGEKLKDIALQFFFDLSELQNDKPKAISSNLKHLALHVPYGFCETYLASLLDQIYTETPDLEVLAVPHDYTEIIRYVEDDTIPFGLTYKLYINGQDMLNYIPENMNFTPLYEAKFSIAVPDKFPIANYKTISLKTVLEYPLISYTPSEYLMNAVYNYYSDITPQIVKAPTVNAHIALLTKEKGISLAMQDSYTNEFALSYPPNTKILALREKVQVIYGYITKKTQLSTDTINQLHYLDRLYHAE